MSDIHPNYGIDFGLLTRPLRRFGRGAITFDELCDAVAFECEFTPIQTLPDRDEDIVETAAALHRRLVDSGAFNVGGDDPTEREELAAQVVIAVILDTQITVVGDLQLRRHREIDPELLRGFRRHWAAQVVDFVQSSPAELQLQRVGMAAACALDRLLPTELLLETISATAVLTPEEFGYRLALGKTLVRRFIDEKDDERAIAFAAGFGRDAHRLLLEAVQALPADSPYWAALMELLHNHREQIIADGDWAAVLYAAANAATGSRFDSANALLAMSQLDNGTRLRDSDPDIQTALQIELHALTAVIHYVLEDHDEALRYAQVCARLASVAESDYDEGDAWILPKAAGWILVTAERDPSSRVLLLKRAYYKYNFRGALEGRLALQAAGAYLELGRPEFAAYFLAQAIDNARVRLISDHFPGPVLWQKVGGLLEAARVADDELALAATELRRLGYLPEPETGSHFWRIDEQWCHRLRSDDPDLISPKPKRA